MKTTKFLLPLSIAAIASMASCKNVDTPKPDQGPRFKIEITAQEGGSAVATVDGLAVTEALEGVEVTITATPNETFRFTGWIAQGVELEDPANAVQKFKMPAGDVSVEAKFEAPKAYLYKLWGPNIALTGMSENGRYVCGYTGDLGIVIDLDKVTYDANGDTFLEEGALKEYLPEENPNLFAETTFCLQGVDNNGNPYPLGVTPDGQSVLNYDVAAGVLSPYVVVNGVRQDLPPATDRYVVDEDYRGACPDVISADGNVIVGRIRAYAMYVSTYWKKDAAGNWISGAIAKDLVVTKDNPPYIDLIEYPVHKPGSGLSYNGKYAAGAIHVGTDNNNPRRPYIHNIETGVTTLVPGVESANTSCVTDDGILFYSTPFVVGGGGSPYVFENGAVKTFSEWVGENYEWAKDYDLGVLDYGVVKSISPDKKVVLWFLNSAEGFVNYVIVVR